MKRTLVTRFQKHVLNPVVRRFAGLSGGSILLESAGHRTGRARRTPVGARRENGSLWVVSEQGRHSAYVRNIEANPRVRVRYKGRWYAATAHLRPDVDPRRHVHGLNGLIVRLVGTDLLAIRIDLDEG